MTIKFLITALIAFSNIENTEINYDDRTQRIHDIFYKNLLRGQAEPVQEILKKVIFSFLTELKNIAEGQDADKYLESIFGTFLKINDEEYGNKIRDLIKKETEVEIQKYMKEEDIKVEDIISDATNHKNSLNNDESEKSALINQINTEVKEGENGNEEVGISGKASEIKLETSGPSSRTPSQPVQTENQDQDQDQNQDQNQNQNQQMMDSTGPIGPHKQQATTDLGKTNLKQEDNKSETQGNPDKQLEETKQGDAQNEEKKSERNNDNSSSSNNDSQFKPAPTTENNDKPTFEEFKKQIDQMNKPELDDILTDIGHQLKENLDGILKAKNELISKPEGSNPNETSAEVEQLEENFVGEKVSDKLKPFTDHYLAIKAAKNIITNTFEAIDKSEEKREKAIQEKKVLEETSKNIQTQDDKADEEKQVDVSGELQKDEKNLNKKKIEEEKKIIVKAGEEITKSFEEFEKQGQIFKTKITEIESILQNSEKKTSGTTDDKTGSESGATAADENTEVEDIENKIKSVLKNEFLSYQKKYAVASLMPKRKQLLEQLALITEKIEKLIAENIQATFRVINTRIAEENDDGGKASSDHGVADGARIEEGEQLDQNVVVNPDPNKEESKQEQPVEEQPEGIEQNSAVVAAPGPGGATNSGLVSAQQPTEVVAEDLDPEKVAAQVDNTATGVNGPQDDNSNLNNTGESPRNQGPPAANDNPTREDQQIAADESNQPPEKRDTEDNSKEVKDEANVDLNDQVEATTSVVDKKEQTNQSVQNPAAANNVDANQLDQTQQNVAQTQPVIADELLTNQKSGTNNDANIGSGGLDESGSQQLNGPDSENIDKPDATKTKNENTKSPEKAREESNTQVPGKQAKPAKLESKTKDKKSQRQSSSTDNDQSSEQKRQSSTEKGGANAAPGGGGNKPLGGADKKVDEGGPKAAEHKGDEDKQQKTGGTGAESSDQTSNSGGKEKDKDGGLPWYGWLGIIAGIIIVVSGGVYFFVLKESEE